MSPVVVAVVDDDSSVLAAIGHLLRSAGYTVCLFGSGRALFADARFGQIDCLVSDVGLGEMDGLELQRQAASRRPELPVILMTGRCEMSKTHAAGPNNCGLFQKPVHAPDFLEAISRAVIAPSIARRLSSADGTC
jgi:FixJ family two-component response regulator